MATSPLSQQVGDAKQMKLAALDDPDVEPLWKQTEEM